MKKPVHDPFKIPTVEGHLFEKRNLTFFIHEDDGKHSEAMETSFRISPEKTDLHNFCVIDDILINQMMNISILRDYIKLQITKEKEKNND